MSSQQPIRFHGGFRGGLIAGCALIAIALLVTFYSVVSGAVSHAALRRTAMTVAVFEAAGARLSLSGPSPR